MFCVGKKLFEIFFDVIVMLNDDNIVVVKGLKGELICMFYFDMEIKVEDNVFIVICFFD